jgi:hypothetical protein
LSLAGVISAIGAIRAAPKIPMRSGAPCPDTTLTLALEDGVIASPAAAD